MSNVDNQKMPNKFAKPPKINNKEELINTLTHGLAAVLSIIALVVLVLFASYSKSPWKIVSSAIYGVTMVIMFVSSTLYHAFKMPKIKNFFHIMDHSSIFLLIAGTYTPFLLSTDLRESFGWALFAVIWGCALVGIILKVFLTGKFKVASTIMYLLMGWIIVFAMKGLWSAIEHAGFFWLIAGGILYSSGTIFYLNKKLKYNHAIWHLFVFAASACHFISILFYVVL